MTLALVLLGIAAIQAFVIFPALSELTSELRTLTEDKRRREKEEETLKRTYDDARSRIIRQHADLISQSEKIKRLTEENLKLAESLNRKARGD